MVNEIKIGNRKIGADNPCFIIAEIGINYNKDLDIAKRMIDVAADAGCDAAKFQLYKVDYLYSKKAGKLDWKDNEKEYSYDIYEANKSFELPFNWIDDLMAYCKKKDILFFSSVWDEPSTDFLENKNIEFYKIGSSALTNTPLLEYVSKKKKPLFIATGGATLGEIEDAVSAMADNNQLVLMHCHLNYPTPPENANINVLNTLKYAFPEAIIGYSDHTEHPYNAPVAAVVNGAKVIEKHITLDKKMEGPDHFFALEPDELKLMVKKIRETENKLEDKLKRREEITFDKSVLGSSKIKPYEDEEYLRKFAYMTVISIKDINKDEKLTKENIRVLRPGKLARGLEPKFYSLLVNNQYKVVKNIPLGKAITWDDVLER